MKILESQQAVLTNYEVYQHILEQRARYAKTKRRGPGNYKTLVDEVSYFGRDENGVMRSTVGSCRPILPLLTMNDSRSYKIG